MELEYLDLYKIDHNILLTNDDATNRSLLNTQLLTLPLNSALLVTVTDNYGTTPLKYNGNNLKQGDILLKTQSGTIYYIAAPQTGI